MVPMSRLATVFCGLLVSALIGTVTVGQEGFASRFPSGQRAIANWSKYEDGGYWRSGRCYFPRRRLTRSRQNVRPQNVPAYRKSYCGAIRMPHISILDLLICARTTISDSCNGHPLAVPQDHAAR